MISCAASWLSLSASGWPVVVEKERRESLYPTGFVRSLVLLLERACQEGKVGRGEQGEKGKGKEGGRERRESTSNQDP